MVRSFAYHLAGLAALYLTASCKTSHDCKDGTVFIAVSCESSPQEADEFVVTVNDDRGGDTHVFGSCEDKPTLQVNLSQYTMGAKFNAAVVFRRGGQNLTQPVNRVVELKSGCTNIDLAIAASDIVLLDPDPLPPSDGGLGGMGGIGGTNVGGQGGDAATDASTDSGQGGIGSPPLAGLGSACETSSDCDLGAFCVSKVCCNTKCEGGCESCLGTDTDGTTGFCKAVKVGADPRKMCSKKTEDPCGAAGSCDGQGQCALAAPGTLCGSAMCGGAGQVVIASACDGKGKCAAGSASGCGGYACKSGSCIDSCAGDGDCVGIKCINGKCGGKRGLGEVCGAANECGSGNCVGGICCDNSCGESCKSCKGSATGQNDGTCAFVKAGDDPGNSCSVSADSCGDDGTCDGAGGCRKKNASTPCGAAMCAGQTYSSARTCDGAGTCKAATTSSCDVYACTASGCKKPCGGDGDCVLGYYCASGTCTPSKAQGATCTTGAQCTTGFCAPEGICCNEACNGTCRQCASGTCINLQGREDPNSCTGDRTCNNQSICVGKMGAKCSTKADCDYLFCDEFFPDADGDGYGDAKKPQRFCLANQGSNFHDVPPAGYVINNGDCCDVDPKSPNFESTSAPNLCGSWDLNCDGQATFDTPECNRMCSSISSNDAYTCFDFTTDSKVCGAPSANYSCDYKMLYYMGQSMAGCR